MRQPFKGYHFHQDFIHPRRFIEEHRRNIRSALSSHGRQVKQKLEELISTGIRTGRVYSFRGRKHIAAADGEPPASRSGRLADSFSYRVTANRMILGNTAWNKSAPYPSYLEEGTTRMGAKPYFRNTINRLLPQLRRDLEDLR